MLSKSAGPIGLALAAAAAAIACTAAPTGPSPVTTGLDRMPSPTSNLTVDAEAVVGAVRFVAFGDSITYGVLSSFDGMMLFDGSPESYTIRLEGSLNTRHAPQRFVVINRGVPAEGVTTAGVRRIASVLSTDRPQALLLLEGINDLADGVPVAQIGSALQTIVTQSLQSGAPVFLATMFQTYAEERPDGTFRGNGADMVPLLNQRIRTIATQQNVYLVDLYPAFGTNRALVGGDGLHPTEAGYQVMADTFLAAIERAFPVRGSFQ